MPVNGDGSGFGGGASPGWPATRSGPESGRRRWLGLGVAAVVGAALASAGVGLATAGLHEPATPVAAPPVVTVTVDPPAPTEPAPLPAAEADRRTCMEGWLAARDLEASAAAARKIIPAGMKLDDPAIQSNPDWLATVKRSGETTREAGQVLESHIVPGTTSVLAAASRTAADALRTLGYSLENFDGAMGNAGTIMDVTGDLMAALCTRLVPK